MNVKPVKDYDEPKYPDLKTVVKGQIKHGRRAKIALACAMTAVSAIFLSQCRGPGYAGGMTYTSAWEQTSEATADASETATTDASETATAGVALLTEDTAQATDASLAGDVVMAESST